MKHLIILFILQLTFLTDRAVHPTSIHSEYVSAKYLTSEINTEFIMLTEQFKPIKGYEGLYEVSNFGRVKSLARIYYAAIYNSQKRILEEKILAPSSSIGTPTLRLCKNGKAKCFAVYHLVWDAFGDRPRNGYKSVVDHIDNNRMNNCIDNLQLLTQRNNVSKSKLLTKRSGLPTGVYKYYNGFIARIQINGRETHLGCFKTPEEASQICQNKIREIT